jgi:sugar lactone lactonase YvrE
VKRIIGSFIGLLLVFHVASAAGGTTFWEIAKQIDIERGDAKGITISDSGDIRLAPSVTQVFNTEQPFVFSSASDASGNIYLGTGHEGRIYKVDKAGKGTMLFDSQELDITALTIDTAGNIYAGSSPNGKVYRITPGGESSVLFDPEDKYIWSLALDKTGNLYVGTGDKGVLYKVDKQGKGTVFANTNEKHIISLEPDGKGSLLAGTDPGGLVLRISPEGKLFALMDSPVREIHKLAVAPDGSIYALGLSAQTNSGSSVTAPVATSTSEGGGTVTVVATFDDDNTTTTSSQSTTSQSRNDITSSKTVLYRITPDGGNDVIWNARETIGFSLAVNKNGKVLVGTGTKGRIYEIDPKGKTATLLLQSSEDQATSLLSSGGNVYVASSNTGKLFRLENETVKEGFYTSPIHDTKFTATWGRLSWRSLGPVELQTRSGNTESPDITWSDWSTASQNAEGQQVSSPPARFIQWRARLQGGASLSGVKLAYLLRNIAPEVTQITVLASGVALQEVPQQPVDPAILSAGLDPSTFGLPSNVQPRKVFQKGARSLQWTAEDRNGDTLSYKIFYRTETDSDWHLLVNDQRNNYYTLDADSLPDGKYLFRILATDLPSNPDERAQQGELVSDMIEIDNTPPQVTAALPKVANKKVEVTFTANDNLSPLRRAEYSVDGSPWQTVFPADGISDSRSESYGVKVELPSDGEHTIAFRCYDDNANPGGTKVTVKTGSKSQAAEAKK